jgi:hypothetical protein
MTSTGWPGRARFVLAGFVVGAAVAWAMGGGQGPVAKAQAPSMAEAAGTIAFTSSAGVPGGAQWLYLIDTRNQAFAVYRVDPQNPKGSVKLEAARHYRWDLRLAEYNNQPPEVAAVESMTRSTK